MIVSTLKPLAGKLSILKFTFQSFSGGQFVMGKKVAVVLSGCGVYDGSEIHEATSTLLHLSRESAEVTVFAPDKLQMHTIDHSKGQPMEPNRNVLVESARIARGAVSPLQDLHANAFDAVIFPGGFGAAKNLSNFAVEQAGCTLDPQVDAVIQSFHAAKKPIGLMCIAPVLAARSLGKVEITLGNCNDPEKWPHSGAIDAVVAMGAKHIPKDVTEVHVDVANKIVTTPAYMCNTAAHNVYDGIGKLVKEVLRLT